MSEPNSSPIEMVTGLGQVRDQADARRRQSPVVERYYEGTDNSTTTTTSDSGACGMGADRSCRSGAPSPTTDPAIRFNFQPSTLSIEFDGLELREGAYYFAYATQHLVMTTCQQLLEEACFDYIKAKHPDLIQHYECDCASALDLPRWLKIFTDCHPLAELVRTLPPLALDEVASVRDIVVQRSKITARGISLILRSVEKFLRLLRDADRLSKVGILERQIRCRIDSMEYEIQIARKNCADSLEEIAEKRQRLIRDWAEQQEEVKRKASLDIDQVVHAVLQNKHEYASETPDKSFDQQLVLKAGKAPSF